MGDGERDSGEAVAGVARPVGSTVDIARVQEVAEKTNAAHRTMGTRLLGLERHGALIGLGWRDDLVEIVGGGIGNGALTALLDHACGLAALMSIDDWERAGATIGLRVDHLARTRSGVEVHVRGRCEGVGDRVAFVTARAFHPDTPDEPVAMATATVACAP